MFAKQYEVWEARQGKPHRIKCEAAIGMQRVKVGGVWHDRNSGGLFDTEAECQKAINDHRRTKSNRAGFDPMFVPVLADE